MIESLYCPLRTDSTGRPKPCLKEKCAWYSAYEANEYKCRIDKNCCAVLELSRAMHDIDFDGITTYEG